MVRPFLKISIHNPKGIQSTVTRLVKGLRVLIYEKEVNALKKNKKLGLKATQLFKFCRKPGLRLSPRLLHQTLITQRKRNSFAYRAV